MVEVLKGHTNFLVFHEQYCSMEDRKHACDAGMGKEVLLWEMTPQRALCRMIEAGDFA